jgi:hypothetical protein
MPERFTAPVTGLYHFAIGQEPHLESDCTEACPMNAVAAALVEAQTVSFVTQPLILETVEERDTAGGWYCNHPECDCREEDDVAAFVAYVQEKCRGARDDTTVCIDLRTARAIADRLDAHGGTLRP